MDVDDVAVPRAKARRRPGRGLPSPEAAPRTLAGSAARLQTPAPESKWRRCGGHAGACATPMTTAATIADLAPLVKRGRVRASDLVEDLPSRDRCARPRAERIHHRVTRDLARAEADAADRDDRRRTVARAAPRYPRLDQGSLRHRGPPDNRGIQGPRGPRCATDAPAVARFRAAGAIIVGKTNLHEFAFGTTNEDSAFGPSRNPHDPSRSPGGSSGGSAISVAAGMALASLGTDTGGSIRIPAGACGIVGLKPRFGEVSCEGVVPLSRTLDHAGPLARTVRDAWILFDVLRGADSGEPGLAPRPDR